MVSPASALKCTPLAELSAGELAGVNGGSHLCLTDTVGHGASFDTPCPTIPINICVDNITNAIVLPRTIIRCI